MFGIEYCCNAAIQEAPELFLLKKGVFCVECAVCVIVNVCVLCNTGYSS